MNDDPENMDVVNNLEVLCSANHQFALSLYSELNKQDGNIFYSPFSIHLIMFMASMGAAADTLDELYTTLQLKKNSNLLDTFSDFLDGLKKFDELKVATGMFIDNSFKIKQNYLEETKNYMKTAVEILNFKENPENQRTYLNEWVEKKTNGKIKNLFPPNSINRETALVLANAIHFKSNWKKKFDEAQDDLFFLTPMNHINVKMMSLTEDLKYYHDTDLKYSALELPYEGYKFKMLILLPDAKDGLRNLENSLNKIQIRGLMQKMNTFKVNVKLPKFKMEQSIDLNDVLIKLGCSTMFSSRANFSKISDPSENPLYISKVLHKAFIDVNEKGTEAAAATGCVNRKKRSLQKESISMTINHPFLFYILNNNNIFIFVGRINTLYSSNRCTPKDEFKFSKNDGNIFYSPLSIHIVMFMAGIGAASHTFNEIFDTLKLPKTNTIDLLETYGKILDNLQKNNELKTANGLFIENSFKVKQSYLYSISTHLKASIEKLNFKEKPEDQRIYLNKWVQMKTDGKIKNLFPQNSFDERTSLVLANAIHFKSDWLYEFKSVKKESFYLTTTEIFNVQMMRLYKKLQYYHDSEINYSMLMLPYKNEKFKMIILLPDAKDGLHNLENNLSKIKLREIIPMTTYPNVNVKLPKFKFEQSIDLQIVLKQLGCSSMFTRTANFSRISEFPEDHMYVSEVLHKAYVEVNEKGTEAAAATGIFINTLKSGPREQEVNFHADHPFIFIIMNDNNNVLFVGRVKKPIINE
ncbi:serpin B4-like [Daktulosphaira vitifoliae]|uniref:serpin B4-like n=1 Tax=Daktulosphaira vitifoliae TaxID=58002 RepID=UPI0021AA8CD3|nr:serpin B4-like [Daktulosphaira vitifoliae]